MEIPASGLQPRATASVAPLSDAVQPTSGQTLEAVVTAVRPRSVGAAAAGFILELDAPGLKGQLEASSARALDPGTKLLLRFVDGDRARVERVIENPRSPLPAPPAQQALREALPRQQPMAQAFDGMARMLQSAPLPEDVRRGLERLLTALPTPASLSSAAGLRAAVTSSGSFLEARLQRSGDGPSRQTSAPGTARAASSGLPVLPDADTSTQAAYPPAGATGAAAARLWRMLTRPAPSPAPQRQSAPATGVDTRPASSARTQGASYGDGGTGKSGQPGGERAQTATATPGNGLKLQTELPVQRSASASPNGPDQTPSQPPPGTSNRASATSTPADVAPPRANPQQTGGGTQGDAGSRTGYATNTPGPDRPQGGADQSTASPRMTNTGSALPPTGQDPAPRERRAGALPGLPIKPGAVVTGQMTGPDAIPSPLARAGIVAGPLISAISAPLREQSSIVPSAGPRPDPYDAGADLPRESKATGTATATSTARSVGLGNTQPTASTPAAPLQREVAPGAPPAPTGKTAADPAGTSHPPPPGTVPSPPNPSLPATPVPAARAGTGTATAVPPDVSTRRPSGREGADTRSDGKRRAESGNTLPLPDRHRHQLLRSDLKASLALLRGALLDLLPRNGFPGSGSIARNPTPAAENADDSFAPLYTARGSITNGSIAEPSAQHSGHRARPELQPPAAEQDALEQLLRYVDGALARTRVHQLSALPEARAGTDAGPGIPAWTVELPIPSPAGFDSLWIRMEEAESGRNEPVSGVRNWSVMLCLDCASLGPLHALVQLSGQRLGATLWAEREGTLAAARAAIAELEEALRSQGVLVDRVECLPGRPPEPAALRFGSLLDVRT